MDGIQKTVAEGLETMVRWVKEGKYGKDDDFDTEYFDEDFADEVTWKS